MWGFGIECSSLCGYPNLVHFNHSWDELGYDLAARLNVLPFPFFSVSLWHGLWEEDSIINSVESFMCYCQFLIYSGNRLRNLFWLSSSGFQPRSLQVSHLLFLGEEIWIERVYIILLQELASLSQITRGYGAARYCGQRRGLFVGDLLRKF